MHGRKPNRENAFRKAEDKAGTRSENDVDRFGDG